MIEEMIEEQHQLSMVQRNSWSIVNHYTVKEGMNDKINKINNHCIMNKCFSLNNITSSLTSHHHITPYQVVQAERLTSLSVRIVHEGEAIT